MITVPRFSSRKPLPSINICPGVILANIMAVLAIEICVGWNMLMHVDTLVSCIQCKSSVTVRLVGMIGSSR